jgi:hypothetical protein
MINRPLDEIYKINKEINIFFIIDNYLKVVPLVNKLV